MFKVMRSLAAATAVLAFVYPALSHAQPMQRDFRESLELKRRIKDRQATSELAFQHARLIEEYAERQLELDDNYTFHVDTADVEEDGTSYARASQYYGGLRILHGHLYSHADTEGQLIEFETQTLKRMTPKFELRPQLSIDEAIHIAGSDREHVDPYLFDPEVELAIYPIQEYVDVETGEPLRDPSALDVDTDTIERRVHEFRLVYVVDTYEGLDSKNPSRAARYLIDGNDGTILQTKSLIQEAFHANVSSGAGLDEYPTGPSTLSTSVDLNTTQVTDDDSLPIPYPDGTYMTDLIRGWGVWDDQFSGFDAVQRVLPGAFGWGDGNPFMGNGAATLSNRQTHMVSANAGIRAMHDMLILAFNRHGATNDPDYTFNVYTHHKDNWNNANYDGCDINTGDGDDVYARLATVAHEYGHMLNDHTGDLEDGLSEGNSDIWAAITMFYVYERGLLNQMASVPGTTTDAYSLPSGNWVNYWYVVGRKAYSPKYKYYFSGIGDEEEHSALGPIVRAFYFMAQGASSNPMSSRFSLKLPNGSSGVGINDAAKIWLHALKFHFDDDTDYITARNLTVASAKHIFGANSSKVKKTRNAWHGVGLGQRDASYVAPPFINETLNVNDFINQAQVINFPASLPSRLEVRGTAIVVQDHDWYTIDVPDGHSATVTVLGFDNSSDFDLDDWESSGGQNVYDNGSHNVGADQIVLNPVGFLPNGVTTYNIRVEAWDNPLGAKYRLYFDFN